MHDFPVEVSIKQVFERQTALLYLTISYNYFIFIHKLCSLVDRKVGVVPGCLILASGSLEDGMVINIMGILSGASSLLRAKKSSILKMANIRA